MKSDNIRVLKNQFDTVIHKTEDGFEFWYARELQELLGYKRWENFETAINRAITSCETTGVEVLTIFVRSRIWFHWVVGQNKAVHCQRTVRVMND